MDCEYDLFEPGKEDWTDVATRRPTDADAGCAEHYVIENERSSASENESCNERMNEDDVNENETQLKPDIRRDVTSPSDELPNGTQNENDVTGDSENAENVSSRGADITVPGISENENSDEKLSSRGTKYNLRPNPKPNNTEEYRY